MEAIASAAGVSRPAMYRYFASKEHVVCEAALAWGYELAQRIPAEIAASASPGDAIDVAIRMVVEEATANLPMVHATISSLLAIGPAADAFRRGLREMFRSLMGRAVSAMPVSAPLDT